MIITCESCKTKFQLDPRLIKGLSSKVRCSQCKHVFLFHEKITRPSTR